MSLTVFPAIFKWLARLKAWLMLKSRWMWRAVGGCDRDTAYTVAGRQRLSVLDLFINPWHTETSARTTPFRIPISFSSKPVIRLSRAGSKGVPSRTMTPDRLRDQTTKGLLSLFYCILNAFRLIPLLTLERTNNAFVLRCLQARRVTEPREDFFVEFIILGVYIYSSATVWKRCLGH